MTTQRKLARAEIADELESWMTEGPHAPDILSATECVADHWKEIVSALRGKKPPHSKRDRMSEAERTGKAGDPFGGIACLTIPRNDDKSE